jgi:hypothetical protein
VDQDIIAVVSFPGIAFSESVPDLAVGLSPGVPGEFGHRRNLICRNLKSGIGIAGHPK